MTFSVCCRDGDNICQISSPLFRVHRIYPRSGHPAQSDDDVDKLDRMCDVRELTYMTYLGTQAKFIHIVKCEDVKFLHEQFPIASC